MKEYFQIYMAQKYMFGVEIKCTDFPCSNQ